MDLLHRDERQIFRADRRLKKAAVFHNVFLGVQFHETEIEHLLAVERADAAEPRAESVRQPGELLEWGKL